MRSDAFNVLNVMYSPGAIRIILFVSIGAEKQKYSPK